MLELPGKGQWVINFLMALKAPRLNMKVGYTFQVRDYPPIELQYIPLLSEENPCTFNNNFRNDC